MPTTTVIAPAYDVIILGGGLAGLTLALHLKQVRPQTSVLVVEKKAHPVNEAAHKVGESSVEIGAGYFTEFLGLLPHFQQSQLPKLGLRYFFTSDQPNDLTTRSELGGNVFFPTPSFQIDRGRFENYLGEEVRRKGVDFIDQATVGAVDLGPNGAAHAVTVTVAGQPPQRVASRWVVDAAGRASLLKRKLDLQKKCGHNANSVWWRYDTHIKIDDWSDDATWQAQNDNLRKRWLSTVHFMGEGYWVWFIPLSSGSHSVGIVADGELHPFATMSSYEKAMEWLRTHEPQCAAHCAGREGQLQDFLGYKDFSYSCKQVYSADRWALVGEAGAFLDPFYSPGSDYIGMGNTFVADLVTKDLAGSPIASYADIFNKIYFSFFDAHLTLYEKQMPIFGNAKVMSLKIIWDFAYYWVIPAAFFFHRRLTDVMAYARHRDLLDRAGMLNRPMQKLFKDWHQADVRIAKTFVDIPGIPFMYDLNVGLKDTLDDAQFAARLESNLKLLERLAGEILGAVRIDLPEVDTAGFVGVPTIEPGHATLLSGVLPLFKTVVKAGKQADAVR